MPHLLARREAEKAKSVSQRSRAEMMRKRRNDDKKQADELLRRRILSTTAITIQYFRLALF